ITPSCSDLISDRDRPRDAGEDRQHDRNGLGGGLPDEAGCERHAGFALMENEHGPCALADDEVALPMADLSSGIGVLGPFVDGDAILDRISRRPRSERTPAFVTSREITPQLLGLLGGAVDEGVDRLAPHGPQTTFISALQRVHPSARRSRTKVRKALSFSINASRRLRN